MSYLDVDFDRHPMPRSVVARIRERLAGKSGDAAAWKAHAGCDGQVVEASETSHHRGEWSGTPCAGDGPVHEAPERQRVERLQTPFLQPVSSPARSTYFTLSLTVRFGYRLA